MANQIDIFEAAMTRISTLSTSTPVAYPGRNFTPPSDPTAIWNVVDHFPNTNRNLVLGAGSVMYLGFVQVRVYFRPDQGIVKALTEAEAIVAHFAKATALGPVRVDAEPSIAPPVYDDDDGFVPVTIPYRGIA